MPSPALQRQLEMSRSIAVVTGGAGDIGRAIAARLCESHKHIVLMDINEVEARNAVDALNEAAKDKGQEPSFSASICDVTDSESVLKAAQSITTSSDQQVCTLVNNAGGSWTRSMHTTTPESWRAHISLNLDSAYYCFRAFEDQLKQTQGSIINITSIDALVMCGEPAYSAAKAGLINFTKSLAVEYGKYGIRANAIAPGGVRTRQWEERIKNNPNVWDDAMQWYPLKRIILPEDVANAVAFLASDQAAAITGVCLPVDAGLLAGQTAVARSITQCGDYA